MLLVAVATLVVPGAGFGPPGGTAEAGAPAANAGATTVTDSNEGPLPHGASARGRSPLDPDTAPPGAAPGPATRPGGRVAPRRAQSTALACPPNGACPAGAGSAVTARSQPSDPTPYGVEAVYGNPALDRTSGGDGVDVAVLDSGVATDHPDLRRRVELCRDYTVEPVRDGSCADDNGHGTHVAGTILADGGAEGNGIYGVAPEADLYAFKICTADGNCTSGRVRAGIRDAVDAGAEIVVLSLGGRRTEHVQSAVEYAHEEGVLVLASAGNRGPDVGTMNYPAADALVVAGGAVGERRSGERIVPADFRVPDFSSRGRDGRSFERADGYLEFAAPGVGVQSTWPGGYATRSGTSLAVPHVAGLAAKLWQGTTDRDGDGHRHEDVRRALQRRAPEFDVTEGEHAREGYDPAAGLGLPQLRPPRARFDLTPPVPTEGRTATFSGAGSTAPDGTVVGYEWDFDADGTVDARGRTASVVFARPGDHTVRLRVIDADGASDTVTRTVRVNAVPTASVTALPPVPAPGDATRFDASGSADPDGSIVAYAWDFDGDGDVDARGPTATHTFAESGVYTVRLRVTDDDGASATTAARVRVTVPPAPSFTADPAIPERGAPVRFDASPSADPDGTVVGYAWDFDGDGATDARGRAVSHTFGTVGPQAVTLRVTDDGGATNATTRSVLVNDRPNVSVAVPPDATAGAPVTLAATVADEVGATTVTWAFPDGTSATGTTVTRTFEPGRQVIAVTAEDEYGARTTREITLTVGAAPGPTATPSDGPPSRTGDGTGTRTTAGSGPGFGWGTVLASGVLALLAVGRRGSVGP